jgi:DNA repair photolyase
MNIHVTKASRGKILVKSGFQGYDMCLNPYVGCQMGCSYCYVRWFIKDKKHEWGEFVRCRDHLPNKLPKELLKEAAGKRIVIGTMTDPYQPQERKKRLTRQALQLLLALPNPPAKVGIFTKSPIVADDIGLIAQLPKGRVHYTITPMEQDAVRRIEQVAISTKRRWKTIKQLRDAGIRVHVNVSPAIPVLSDPITKEIAQRLVDYGVSEFFVDPMQAYKESYEALTIAMQGHPAWPRIDAIMSDKAKYAKWKEKFRRAWFRRWSMVGSPDALAIWCDHINKVWVDMATGKALNQDNYGS